MSGRLVVCPTPIGNLEDVTLRLLTVLQQADVIACEDTRHTRKLLVRHGITAETVSYHEHNEHERTARLVTRIVAGEVVALVTDAGIPLISDPGRMLVDAVIAEGLTLEVLPGPSAVTTALVASGLVADRWSFVGFLPRRHSELLELFAGATVTTVAFESPRRLAATLALIAALDDERPCAVCRELTKVHEEITRGTAGQLAAMFSAREPRGEIVLVVGGAAVGAGEMRTALAALVQIVEAGARLRPAATAIAALTGLKANALYAAYNERRS